MGKGGRRREGESEGVCPNSPDAAERLSKRSMRRIVLPRRGELARRWAMWGGEDEKEARERVGCDKERGRGCVAKSEASRVVFGAGTRHSKKSPERNTQKHSHTPRASSSASAAAPARNSTTTNTTPPEEGTTARGGARGRGVAKGASCPGARTGGDAGGAGAVGSGGAELYCARTPAIPLSRAGVCVERRRSV